MKEIIIAIIAFIVGIVITFLINSMKNKGKANHILEEAKKTAEQIKTDKILQAKEKFLELKSKHEIVINQKNQKVLNSENRISEKENKISPLTS